MDFFQLIENWRYCPELQRIFKVLILIFNPLLANRLIRAKCGYEGQVDELLLAPALVMIPSEVRGIYSVFTPYPFTSTCILTLFVLTQRYLSYVAWYHWTR
jgi:hypothetical protein